MRFDGKIKTWNDDRGFGFIAPTLGGQEIFAHIKAFRTRGFRPEVGQPVTFEVELNLGGKKRAKAVEPLRPRRPASSRGRAGSAQWGTASWFAIPAFLLLYLVVAVLWRVPGWVAGAYLGASFLAYLIYAADKSAARAERWRVSESTLLSIGLVGGWPGAIVAQQTLRHKSAKRAFRDAFWGTVALNVLAFVVVFSPLGQRLVAAAGS